MNLTIRIAEASDLNDVKRWLQVDPPRNFDIRSIEPSYGRLRSWVALDGSEVVAYASVYEDSARQASLSFIVKPARRREGIAKAFISQLVNSEHLNDYNRITCATSMGDTALSKILKAAGFIEAGYNQDGLQLFEKR